MTTNKNIPTKPKILEKKPFLTINQGVLDGLSIVEFLSQTLEENGKKVLNWAYIDMNKIYFAVKEDNAVTALIAFIEHDIVSSIMEPTLKAYFLSEEMIKPSVLQIFDTCPGSVIEQLSDSTSTAANRWRSACMKRHKAKDKKFPVAGSISYLENNQKEFYSDQIEHPFFISGDPLLSKKVGIDGSSIKITRAEMSFFTTFKPTEIPLDMLPILPLIAGKRELGIIKVNHRRKSSYTYLFFKSDDMGTRPYQKIVGMTSNAEISEALIEFAEHHNKELGFEPPLVVTAIGKMISLTDEINGVNLPQIKEAVHQ